MSIKDILDERIGMQFQKDVARVYNDRVAYYEVHNVPLNDYGAKLIKKESEQVVADRFPYKALRKLF